LHKKDLSLLVLILVVGAVVAFINPRFLLAGNLQHRQPGRAVRHLPSPRAFVIIVGGIELSCRLR
jgi:ribose transport system permease protein